MTVAIRRERWLEVMVSAVVERWRKLAKPTTADSLIVVVLVLALVEQWSALATPTTVDSSIAEVPVSVERRRGLVARTLVPVPHIHTNSGRTHTNMEPHTNMEHTLDTRRTLEPKRTQNTGRTLDTGRSNTVTHRRSDTVGNSREPDKPDQIPLQQELGLQCRFGLLPMPGPKTMTMP
jgi:hypothetical protein